MSSVDPNVPASGRATTASVRANFQTVKTEIDALQAADAALANSTDLTQGDALIAVKLNATGSVARTQHDKNAESVSDADLTLLSDAFAAGETSGELLITTGTKVLAAGLSAEDVILKGRSGSVLRATNGIDILTANGFVVVDSLSFDIFRKGVNNANTTANPVDIAVWLAKFTNGDGGQPINIEAPIDRILILGNRFNTNEAAQIRLGQNTQSLQAGWLASAVAFNSMRTVNSAGLTSTVGGVLSYVPFTRIIGNDVRDVNGASGDETFFYYVKSIGAVVALNAGDDLGTDGTIYGINLKGSSRGDTSTPQGYGAMALGNSIRHTGGNVGIQMQADEQAIIANWIDNFRSPIEMGTSPAGMGIISLNRATSDGTSGSEFVSGGIEGTQFLEALNISRGGIDGSKFSVNTGKTFDRYSIIGSHHSGSGAGNGGNGIQVNATDVGSVTNLEVAHTTIAGFSGGVSLTGVTGAKLNHIAFQDVTNNTSRRPYALTNCKNVRMIDGYSAKISTTNNTATSCYAMTISDGNVLHLKVKAMAIKTGGNVGNANGAVEFLERECVATQAAGTATVAASKALVELVTGTGLVIDFTISSNRVTARITGVGTGGTAENWDWTVWVDFELH